MFEKSVDTFDAALRLEGDYIDSLNSQASSLLVLGRYDEHT